MITGKKVWEDVCSENGDSKTHMNCRLAGKNICRAETKQPSCQDHLPSPWQGDIQTQGTCPRPSWTTKHPFVGPSRSCSTLRSRIVAGHPGLGLGQPPHSQIHVPSSYSCVLCPVSHPRGWEPAGTQLPRHTSHNPPPADGPVCDTAGARFSVP